MFCFFPFPKERKFWDCNPSSHTWKYPAQTVLVWNSSFPRGKAAGAPAENRGKRHCQELEIHRKLNPWQRLMSLAWQIQNIWSLTSGSSRYSGTSHLPFDEILAIKKKKNKIKKEFPSTFSTSEKSNPLHQPCLFLFAFMNEPWFSKWGAIQGIRKCRFVKIQQKALMILADFATNECSQIMI